MSDDENKKSGSYRLEYASSGRAKCPKPCAGTLINKGDLRLGTQVTFAGRTSMAWRHWGCTTSRIIANFKKSFSSPEDLDGFEELKKEDKERVRTAWEEGHVADEDVPETAQKGAEDEEGEEKKKPKAKPRTVAKKTTGPKRDKVDPEDDEDEEEPSQKKAVKKAPAKKEKAPAKKAPPKKKATKKRESESGEDFGDEIDNVSDEDEDEEAESGKKRKRPASKKEPEPKKAKKPTSKKSKKKAESEDDDDDF